MGALSKSISILRRANHHGEHGGGRGQCDLIGWLLIPAATSEKLNATRFKLPFLLQTLFMQATIRPSFALNVICSSLRLVAVGAGLSLAPTLALAQTPPASAPPAEPDALQTSPTFLRATTEVLTLPGKEKMGMLGTFMLVDVADGVSLGAGTYGAITGQRGGFITLGGAAEIRQRITPKLVAHAGLFVGAGGGRGGFQLAGGGLMLRTDVGLKYETDGYGNLGLGISHVNFPSGVIRSTQPYLMYEYPFYSLVGTSGSKAGGGKKSASSLSAKEQEFAVIARNYRIPTGVVRDDGTPQFPKMQLAGAEWLSYMDENWFLKVEAEGAAGGQSNGYMQIFLGGGYRLPITRSTSIKLHAAAGPAGGGGVDTGGGVVVDAGIGLNQKIFGNNAIELSLSQVRAPSRSFKATSLGIKLVHSFGLPQVGSRAVAASSLAGFEPQHVRIRAVQQNYAGTNPKWRNREPDTDVGNLGVQFDYFVTPNVFLTGQGLAAYSGKAGAYMKGLLGGGYRQPITGPWFAELEGLVGAAGGGGLAVGGGLVAQGNASVGYQINRSLSVMATAGRIKALRGDFEANVLGLSLGYQFNLFSKAP